MINIQLVLAIVFSILATYAIYKIRKITNKFSFATLTALTLGVVLGIIFKENILFLDTVGKAYMSLIKMIVVPLVVTSLITSIVRLENLNTLKSIGIKTFTVLLGTTGAAAIIGIIVASALRLGQGLSLVGAENFKPREIPEFSKVFIDMLPSNPLAAIVDNKIIPIVIFSMFVAIALVIEDNTNKEKAKPFKDFVLSAYDVVLRITKMVLRIIPYGVFALIATAAAKNGVDTLMSLIWVIAAVYIAALLQFLFVYTPLVSFVGKMNPLKFFKGIFPAQVVAFTSQSSYGTLPVTIKSLVEGVGVSENIASFVAPLGSTIGLNGCGGFYPAIVAIFAANMFNMELTMYSYILIVLTAVISSIGIAGVPGSATMSTTVMLAALGLPIEALAMVIAVDSIIDMIRTATNVTGASVAALVVDQTEKRKEYEVNSIAQEA
ncbi:dicarboxylate/amino acid:cation symporter [Clostridium sp. LIBA-8841]|uniref:dicarboxylate/amino acid:cation symporter n=1 Tax=Clostridium sp. LIBA-8841 TaxID=2987530 RepID=UPI002AC5C862|nr:dicarboxylate/amino acid:cation symporter [Clostridium sp. LIBA-8841]MDZ5253467.1 dicarboxylate/amino acid:cation symporter [Clostridium sp. LIBA-8841]